MKAFARVTALVFSILGLLIIFGGVLFAFSGIIGQAASKPPMNNLIPDFSGLIVVVKLFCGGAIVVQGFFLSAIGQVLWLVAAITENTEKTSQATLMLLRRTNQGQ